MSQPDRQASDLFARTAVHSWKLTIGRLDQTFAACSDDELQVEVAPGKNRIFYLVGHLAAVHDLMLPLLRLGERLHPELDQDFLTNPDRTDPDRVSAATLRQAWTEVNATLTGAIEALPVEGWLERHNAVSAEDFARQPVRNRLAVLLSRTGHAEFHMGQIRLIAKKN